jgi:hypothetical protein
MRVSRGSFGWISQVSIAMLAIALTVFGVSQAHAARDLMSPDKACSNGTSCFNVMQAGKGEGIVSTSQLGNAVEAHNPGGNAIYAETNNPSNMTKHCAYGVVGIDQSDDGGTMNFGVSGRSYHGTGIFGTSGTGIGVSGTSRTAAGLAGTSASAVEPALSIQATGRGPLMFARNAMNDKVLKLDQAGNLTIAGVIKTAGSCREGCSKPGAQLISYAPRESSPTMEDFGEGQLVDGSATIRIDPAFANAIDPSSGYLVFITPYGDSKGLYVAVRSAGGFQVRESGGGRSTLAFGYRIVAKPYGSTDARLPLVTDSSTGR